MQHVHACARFASVHVCVVELLLVCVCGGGGGHSRLVTAETVSLLLLTRHPPYYDQPLNVASTFREKGLSDHGQPDAEGTPVLHYNGL